MSTINLGRVQGAGIFYSTASSGTSVAKSTLAPNGIVPLVGDSILFPNGDLRKITAVSETNVTCGNVETNFKERPSNVLQEVVMVNRTAGVTEGDMINLGYALGLEEGKQYIVKYKFNGSDIVATAKYEAPTGLPMEGGELCLCQSAADEGMTMTFPMLLGISQYSAAVEDYVNAAQNYGFLFIVDKHQITDDMIYMDDENNSSFYVRALQSSNAQNAVSVEISAIEPFTEVVVDKAIADGEGNNIVSTYAQQNGSYPTLGAGHLATQIKITATSEALVGWHKFAEIQYSTVQLNNTYSAILLVNGVNSSQYAETQLSKAESGEIEIDFYKAATENPIQIAVSVLSGNINADELCAVLDTANSKIHLYMYLNQYQATAYSLLSEEQTYSEKYAKLVFVSEYHGTTVPDGAIYAVVRNNASELNGKAASYIFESDGVTAKEATNAQKLGDKAASEYALGTDIPNVSDFAEKTGNYPNMTTGNATNSTNIIPDENGAVNPGGRKADSNVGGSSIALGNNSEASGGASIAIGMEATASGANSTVLGRKAIASKIGATAIGSYSEATGEESIAIGQADATGDNAIAIGYAAKATGYQNSAALGRGAIASGARSIALGNGANALGSDSAALGKDAIVNDTDNKVIQLGASDLSTLRCAVNLTVTSDARDKTDIASIANALAFIERLNPVTFVRNDRVEYISDADKESETFRKYGMCEYDRVSHAAGVKKGERRRCGLLAQEVIAAMQEVYGTDNYANIVNDNFHDLAVKPSDVENKYTLAYANLVPFLVGAIQELNAKIKSLEDKLK